MPSSCCAVECRNRCKAGKVTLYTFPKNPVRRRQWIQAIHREAWEPTQYSRVCGRHFISGRHGMKVCNSYTVNNQNAAWLSVIFCECTTTTTEVFLYFIGRPCRLKWDPDYAPSIFSFKERNEKVDKDKLARSHRLQNRRRGYASSTRPNERHHESANQLLLVIRCHKLKMPRS